MAVRQGALPRTALPRTAAAATSSHRGRGAQSPIRLRQEVELVIVVKQLDLKRVRQYNDRTI